MTIKEELMAIIEAGVTGSASDLQPLTTSESVAYVRSILNTIADRQREGRSYVYFDNSFEDVTGKAPDLYKEYIYTFRILGTNKKGSKNAWDTSQNLDASIKGIVPNEFTEDQVKAKIHDDLFERTREILDSKGVMMREKFDGSVGLDDEDIITGDGSDGVSGVEFGGIQESYDPNVEIEVVYTNSEGITYDKEKGMGEKAQKEINDWF